MVKSYSLTEDAFKRTKAAVLRVESTPRTRNIPQRRRHVAGSGGGTFRRIEFTLPSALTASEGSVADCPVVTVWYGADPGTTITVYNDYGWESDAGSTGIADYRPTDGHWVIVLLPCATGAS